MQIYILQTSLWLLVYRTQSVLKWDDIFMQEALNRFKYYQFVWPKEYSSKKRLCFKKNNKTKNHHHNNKKTLPPHFCSDPNMKYSSCYKYQLFCSSMHHFLHKFSKQMNIFSLFWTLWKTQTRSQANLCSTLLPQHCCQQGNSWRKLRQTRFQALADTSTNV